MGEFEVIRSTVIAAPRERVHALIDDFHQWRDWSPWEDLDPNLERDYSGAPSGPGARYAWEGNRKAGKGAMEIVESTPDKVRLKLQFEKPWKATNDVDFTLTPAREGTGDTTTVSWRMAGETKGLAGVVSKLFPMERMVGKDFEKGLARLKSKAESG
jgi:uncharacterized protein YndB with AHSA1/START domain